MKKLLVIICIPIFSIILMAPYFAYDVYLTAEGGVAVYLTNQTGANTVKGQVVIAATNNPNAFVLCTNQFDIIGIVYSNGIANGSRCFVVVAGIADVLLQSNTWVTNGNWVYATTNSRANGSLQYPDGGYNIFSIDYFKSIGYSLQITNSTNTDNATVRVLLKFR
jgi:hypothetical protein